MADEETVKPEAAEEPKAPESNVKTLMLLEIVNVEEDGKVRTFLVQHDPDSKNQQVWRDPQLRVDTFTVPVPADGEKDASRKLVGSTMVITCRREYE